MWCVGHSDKDSWSLTKGVDCAMTKTTGHNLVHVPPHLHDFDAHQPLDHAGEDVILGHRPAQLAPGVSAPGVNDTCTQSRAPKAAHQRNRAPAKRHAITHTCTL